MLGVFHMLLYYLYFFSEVFVRIFCELLNWVSVSFKYPLFSDKNHLPLKKACVRSLPSQAFLLKLESPPAPSVDNPILGPKAPCQTDPKLFSAIGQYPSWFL